MGHFQEYKVAQKHKFTHSSLTLLKTHIVFMYESRCIHKHAATFGARLDYFKGNSWFL